MTSFSPPSDAQLMLMSAFLDGELSPAEEAEVIDALSQNPQLVDAFEAMSAARLAFQTTELSPAGLSGEDSAALLASVMAATSPADLPDSIEGALFAAQLAVDGAEPGDAGHTNLDAYLSAQLQKPGAAPAVSGFLASVEASQAALRGVASVPSVVASLRAVPDHVAAIVAADERLGALATAAFDDALSPDEAHELDALLPRGADDIREHVLAFEGARHAGEALRAAAASPAFMRLAARAGGAALQAIDAEARQAATSAAASAKAVESGGGESWLERLRGVFGAVRAPLAFAGGAFALFFVVSGGPTETAGEGRLASAAARSAVEREILDVWTRELLASAPEVPMGDMPLLADNSADVEAIDSAGNTVVFATESSNITVIWVSATDEEQGT